MQLQKEKYILRQLEGKKLTLSPYRGTFAFWLYIVPAEVCYCMLVTFKLPGGGGRFDYDYKNECELKSTNPYSSLFWIICCFLPTFVALLLAMPMLVFFCFLYFRQCCTSYSETSHLQHTCFCFWSICLSSKLLKLAS